MSNPSPVTLIYIIQTDTVQNVFNSDDKYNTSNHPIESRIEIYVARDKSGRGGVGWDQILIRGATFVRNPDSTVTNFPMKNLRVTI